jgi:exodeoxyribonuclease VII small subunit
MAKKPDENDAEPALSFEELMKKLEAVVARLERGDLSLEDSLKSYEEGIALVRSAQGRLDGMDKRLEELLKDGQTRPIADRPDKAAQKPG